MRNEKIILPAIFIHSDDSSLANNIKIKDENSLVINSKN